MNGNPVSREAWLLGIWRGLTKEPVWRYQESPPFLLPELIKMIWSKLVTQSSHGDVVLVAPTQMLGHDCEEEPEPRTIKMNRLVNETETTKVWADLPGQLKQKAAIVALFSLVAAAALFIGIATFGIYIGNQWTAAIQRGGADAGRSGASGKVDWNDTPPVTGSDDSLH